MKDYLLKHGEKYIECELNDLELTYTFSDEPKMHFVNTLRSLESYHELKKELDEIFDSFYDKDEGFAMVCEYLETVDCSKKYFVEEDGYVYNDLRDREEIHKYLDEAFDKVWLMRNCDISRKIAAHDTGIPGMNRIINTYDDIPKDGYTDWECGYWNGIMGALRWVLGEDKDFLDT